MKLKDESKKLFAWTRTQTWIATFLWTGCIVASSLWNLHEQDERLVLLASNTAEVTFDNDVLYRRWVARQGGVYVRVNEHVRPNPYLKVLDRDVKTEAGLALTLVNPAYMARMVNEMNAEGRGRGGHITSLKPIRPENSPDAWEVDALQAFEKGVMEVTSLQWINGGEYLRIMRPFLVEEACLTCHASQGYKVGDIRGGISVAVAMAPLRAVARPQARKLALAHLGLWLVGLAGIGLSNRELRGLLLSRESAEASLRQNEERYRLLVEQAVDGIFVSDAQGHYLDVNSAGAAMLGYPREEILRMSIANVIDPCEVQRIPSEVAKFQGGRVASSEWRFRRKDGTFFPGEVVGRKLPDGRLQAILRDVTERKQAEDALRQAHDTLERRVEERTAELSRTVETLHAEVNQRTLAEKALRESSAQLRRMASELTLAEQRERQRLARVLHDGLQQTLAAAKLRLASIERSTDIRGSAAEVAELIDDAIESSRSLSGELSPPVLRLGGLVPALEWLARWMHDKHGLNVELIAREQIGPAPEEVLGLIFQATRELLFNVVKHAGIRAARVRVSQLEGQIQIEVKDEGKGFNPDLIRNPSSGPGGIGLFSISDRLSLLGGRMEVESAPGHGSRFTLFAPCSTPTPDAGAEGKH
jgi:PAS domain S-box-containing protein